MTALTAGVPSGWMTANDSFDSATRRFLLVPKGRPLFTAFHHFSPHRISPPFTLSPHFFKRRRWSIATRIRVYVLSACIIRRTPS
jgi:hypothetical protein